MTLTLRKNKNAPLTIEELDGNFENLDTRLNVFEKQTEKLEIPSEFLVENGTFLIKGSKGSLLGKVPLPSPKLSFKGTWKPEINYTVNDLITHKQQLLMCKISHKTKTFDKIHWEVVLESPEPAPVPQPQKVAEGQTPIKAYERDKLPKASLGTIAYLVDQDESCLVYSDGSEWHSLTSTPLDG